MLLSNLAEAAPKLHTIAMAADDEFLLKYVDIVQKKALPNEKEVSVDNVRERVQATLRIIGEHCDPALAETLYQAIEPVWK